MASEQSRGERLGYPLPEVSPWGPPDPCREQALSRHAELIRAITTRHGNSPVNRLFGPDWGRNPDPSLTPGGAYFIGYNLYPSGERVPFSVPILDQGHAVYPPSSDGLAMLRATMQRVQADVDPRDLLTYASDTVYGRPLADFMARGDRHRYIPADQRTQLLEELGGEARRIYARLQEYPSLRTLAQRDPHMQTLGHRSEPWRLVALLGDGEPLDPKNEDALLKLAQYGPPVGLHFLIWNIPTHPGMANATFVGRDITIEAAPGPDPEDVARVSREISSDLHKPRTSPDYHSFSPEKLWQERSIDGIEVTVGVGEDGSEVQARMGDQNPHWLIVGPTGTGKTTIFKHVVCQIAEKYPPEEVEIHYLDYKDSVDAATLVSNGQNSDVIPQIKTVAYNNVDHEFGLSVLKDLVREKERRSELFKEAGTNNLAEYRGAGGDRQMPRIVIAIDEFHKLLRGHLAQEVFQALEELARDSRSAGIHLMIGSQVLPDARDLPAVRRLDTLYDQFTMRVALPQAQGILRHTNRIAEDIPRFSAVFNNASGAVTGNRVVRFPDVNTNVVNAVKGRLAKERRIGSMPPPHVYDGWTKLHLSGNAVYRDLEPSVFLPPRAIVGQEITRDGLPARVEFIKASRRNAGVYGRTPEINCDVIDTMVRSLSRQHGSQASQATFRVVCASRNEVYAIRADQMVRYLTSQGQTVRAYGFEDMNDVVDDASGAVAAAMEGTKTRQYVIAYGLDEAAGVINGEKLGKVLIQGPRVGVHTIFSCNTPKDLGDAIGGLFVDITKFSDVWIGTNVTADDLAPLRDAPHSQTNWQVQTDRIIFYDKSQAEKLGGRPCKLRVYQPS